jgi:hypothetical protein
VLHAKTKKENENEDSNDDGCCGRYGDFRKCSFLHVVTGKRYHRIQRN